ncbi:Tyrosine type site-specific recombinase [Christiangramia flava JLT2011]|uniref:Phage integrase family protein n=2 Tax=Christiangramia TaxID=292691 RepID=A0A1L7I0Z2_9FLAO|nr:phage integrase family protein [Christiangramia flava JLT2011]OSS39864.1 Tyrosine type site-specific recombinase [Christiangramia flava JLT2011]
MTKNMSTSYQLSFYLRKSRSNKSSESDIYVRISVDNKRSAMTINRKVDPRKWHSKSEKMLGKSPEAIELNNYINVIKNRIKNIHQELIEKKKSISSKSILDEFKGVNKKKPKMTLEVFNEHNEQMDRLSGKSISKSTAKRYWTCYNHVEQFINEELKAPDYPMNDINHQFITKFEYFLKTKRECNHNSALKYVNNFKKIIRIALANQWMDRDPFYNYKVQFETVEREFLNEEEVQKLINKDLHLDRLKLVRDMFVFSCYTGLAYSDVKKLSRADITKGIDGGKWIRIKRTKTKSLSSIPLLPVAEEILNRYKDHPEVKDGKYVLPVLSNQKSNAFLKEIAALCGIKKPLTTHLARHTFATTITLTNGVPIESVSKMLGHQDLRTTQHYAKIVDRKISDDMKMLKLKLARKEAKNPSFKKNRKK